MGLLFPGVSSYWFLLVVALASLLLLSDAMREGRTDCGSSCGNLNITSPFRLQGDPQDCGRSELELICKKNQTVFDWQSMRYYVEEIQGQEIRVVDPGVFGNNCSYLPSYDFPDPEFLVDFVGNFARLVFFNCLFPLNDSKFVATAPCINSSSAQEAYAYVLVNATSVGEVPVNCTIEKSVPMEYSPSYTSITTYSDVRRLLRYGIYVRFFLATFESSSWSHGLLQWLGRAFEASIHPVGNFLLGRTSLGMLCLSVLLIYKLRRNHLAMDEKIEEFLTGYKNQMPTRYSYWEIWLMTNRFRDKLGQGGFGSVYKGKLRNGRPIAVKLLSKSKGNGQDFVNEVATIGRIHHANVVQLIGFCAEGSKRALIYEFMPNGSLDKYHFHGNGTNSSSDWDKLQKIALGIARGIEYLHRGCDIKILHFDIKPQNILLDENFVPKISDFGLAKYYSLEDSIFSVTAVRGTVGYIAPELFYRRVGNITCKSDVYSYGMMLMEIAGQRRTIEPRSEKTSEIYFPSWIYNKLNGGEQGVDIGIIGNEATDDDKEMAKKLIIVGLWCIQMQPVDRPSMTRVIEMLEGRTEDLQMPAKPFLSSPPRGLDLEDLEATNSEWTMSTEQCSQPQTEAAAAEEEPNGGEDGLYEASSSEEIQITVS